MELHRLVDLLVDDRSLDALQRLTGSRNEEVLEALIEAAGRILGSERGDPSDDEIVDEVRQHLVDCKAVGPLVDALQLHALASGRRRQRAHARRSSARSGQRALAETSR